ncbi:MAG TPA: metallopeptidase TldD-related protein [Thermoanaerobaculia bacterium]|nr:metallopeptidase TldD-related protein [Thermoanaerobaculia bacterium]
MSWTKQDAKKLSDQILSFSKAPECEVALAETSLTHTRFAANEITTSGSTRDLSISITSRGEGKSGRVRANDLDPESLRKAVDLSEELMRSATPDPESVEGLGPQSYPEIHSFHQATARAGALEHRPAVKAALDEARARKLTASGFSEASLTTSAIANKKGNFGFHEGTKASYSTTMRTADGTGSGWAGFESPRFGDLKATDLAARAARKALASASPKELPPGAYTVILEPRAVADLLGTFFFSSMSRRQVDEGRSFLSKPGGENRIGETVFAPSVTLRSDPFDPRLAGRPWVEGSRGGFLGFGGFGGGGDAGLPSRKTTWVEKGVVKAVPVDRYWAAKNKLDALPFSGSVVLEGGAGTVDELIAGTERGLLVTHFFYIRSVNPQTVQLTGLTRDGLWLVEKGKVVGPVQNFRFNDSPVNVLKNVEAMSASGPAGSMIAPAIRVRDFKFTSKSDAV